MYILGDNHGNINYIKSYIDSNGLNKCDIFHVGDYEVGFVNLDRQIENINNFNKWLSERDIFFYSIRGNHDDPKYFNGDYIGSHLKFMPDYTVVDSDGYKLLLVGGAISLDRYYRKGETNYWEDEGFVLDLDIIKELENIDIVITHTAPSFCSPIFDMNNIPEFLKKFSILDPGILEDIHKERGDMDELFNILNIKNNIKYHFYGHFHRYDITDNLYTQHIVLNKSEFYEVEPNDF